MSEDEIVACTHQAVGFGYGSTVLQAGEDPELTEKRWRGSSAASRRKRRSR